MSTQPRPVLTAQQYLAIERGCENKHEFCRGEMFAMGGASRQHNLIAMNISASLHTQLKEGNCEAYASDMRVFVSDSGLYTYPDIVVTCEDPEFEDDHFDTLMNPQVIFEVLSDSTVKYDRGKKFEYYRRIVSLKDYLLVAQDRAHVEHFARQAEGDWLHCEADGLDSEMSIATIGCRLAMADVYAKVDFPSTENSSGL